MYSTEELDRMVQSTDWTQRNTAAIYGNDRHRDNLVTDSIALVRDNVARFGNDRQRDILAADPDGEVRRTVAMYGNDRQRDRLINDPYPAVRFNVARFGNDRQRQQLSSDGDESVRNEAVSAWNLSDAEKVRLNNLSRMTGSRLSPARANYSCWIVEFNEHSGSEKNYKGMEVSAELLSEIKSLDETMLATGRCPKKFYFDRISGGTSVEHIRIDVGDGISSNRELYEYIEEELDNVRTGTAHLPELSPEERMELAKNGTDEQRNILIDDESAEVRAAVAQYGSEAQRDLLISDCDPYVRCAVVQYGNDRQRTQLISDPSADVRLDIVCNGNNFHRDCLIGDPDMEVREAICCFGNDRQRLLLINDPEPYVRASAAEYGNDRIRELLLHDPDMDVRFNVARFGSSSLIKPLCSDSEPDVRREARNTLTASGIDAREITHAGKQIDMLTGMVTIQSSGKSFPISDTKALSRLSTEDIRTLLAGTNTGAKLVITPKGASLRETGRSLSSPVSCSEAEP